VVADAFLGDSGYDQGFADGTAASEAQAAETDGADDSLFGDFSGGDLGGDYGGFGDFGGGDFGGDF
jgi:hypothetical protein